MKKFMELCRSRHDIPQAVDGAIFATTLDPLDIAGMEAEAAAVLDGCDELVLYVTGLSVALLSVVNVCYRKGINLICMHYNVKTGEYFPHPMF